MNKKGYLGVGEVTFIVFVVFTFLICNVLFLRDTERIVIEKNFEPEYDLCVQSLDSCEQSKVPQCAEVKCTQGAFGIICTIIGIIFYLATLIFGVLKNNELKEREKNIEQQEKDQVKHFEKLASAFKRKRYKKKKYKKKTKKRSKW